ncbi:MAG: hypothetical protein ACT4QE_11165, partial [Anaerolineales bacterium]
SGVNGFTVSFILRGLGVQQGCDLLALMTRQVVAIRFSLTPIGVTTVYRYKTYVPLCQDGNLILSGRM